MAITPSLRFRFNPKSQPCRMQHSMIMGALFCAAPEGKVTGSAVYVVPCMIVANKQPLCLFTPSYHFTGCH